MQKLFEQWASVTDFLGGSHGVHYPRWLRRVYIVTWPVAAPLRLVVFIAWWIVGLAGLLLAALPIGIYGEMADAGRRISHHWNDI